MGIDGQRLSGCFECHHNSNFEAALVSIAFPSLMQRRVRCIKDLIGNSAVALLSSRSFATPLLLLLLLLATAHLAYPYSNAFNTSSDAMQQPAHWEHNPSNNQQQGIHLPTAAMAAARPLVAAGGAASTATACRAAARVLSRARVWQQRWPQDPAV